MGVVNNGRQFPLKYLIILIKIDKEHRLFKGRGESISLGRDENVSKMDVNSVDG